MGEPENQFTAFMARAETLLAGLQVGFTELKQDNREIRAEQKKQGESLLELRTEFKTRIAVVGVLVGIIGPVIIGLIVKFVQFGSPK